MLLIYAWMLALAASVQNAAAGAARPSAAEFLQKQCQAQEAEHTSLVTQMLLPWQDGLDITRVMDVDVDLKPIIYFTAGKLAWHPSLNADHNSNKVGPPFTGWAEVAQAVVDEVVLPDSALLVNPMDGPNMDGQLPWLGYCHIRMNGWGVSWPINLQDAQFSANKRAPRAGVNDTRTAKVVFRGSGTGWHWGRRRALMIAGQRHADLVDAGLVGLSGCGQCHEVDPVEVEMFKKPMMTMQEQMDSYQYIVSADGNCAANRVKHLLSGDSALFMVQSTQEEWFYPLLQPYRHYIPIAFEPNKYPADYGLDIADRVQWAQSHPEEVAEIVRHANDFARLHLSRLGQVCFIVRMLSMYHDLLQGVDNMTALIDAEAQSWKGPEKKGVLHRARSHLGHLLEG